MSTEEQTLADTLAEEAQEDAAVNEAPAPAAETTAPEYVYVKMADRAIYDALVKEAAGKALGTFILGILGDRYGITVDLKDARKKYATEAEREAARTEAAKRANAKARENKEVGKLLAAAVQKGGQIDFKALLAQATANIEAANTKKAAKA